MFLKGIALLAKSNRMLFKRNRLSILKENRWWKLGTNRYQLQTQNIEDIETFQLVDTASHCIAEIAPEIGNHIYRYECNDIPVILSPDSLTHLKNEDFAYYKSGIPMMFPPNRITKGTFTFKGRSYHLPMNEPPLYNLHGVLGANAWKVITQGASNEHGAYVRSQFRFAEHPEIISHFPHQLVFTVTYRLYQGILHMETSIFNEGTNEAPFAFGLHPYFLLPFETGERILLKIPTKAQWPTTNLSIVSGESSVTSYSLQMNTGVAIEQFPKMGCAMMEVDHSIDAQLYACQIQMVDRGYAITYQVDHQFPFVLLYRPDDVSAFSIEPYTCLTDAFNLPYAHDVTGVRGIQAQEEITLHTRLGMDRI
jgi:aldose 1-epimerase